MRREFTWISIVFIGIAPLVATSDDEDEGATVIEVHGHAGGPLVPLEAGAIRLVSERLLIDFGAQTGTVDNAAALARAEYLLDNPGPARRVRFGVPLLWGKGSVSPGYSEYADPLEPMKAGARRISISVAGRRQGCELEVPKGARPKPHAVLNEAVAGWCTATLALPHGRVSVVLEHFLGSGATFEARRIECPLGSGGHWKDPVDELVIEADLGTRAAGAKIVSPPDGKQLGRKVEWRFGNAHLDSLGSVVIDVGRSKGEDRFIDGGWSRTGAGLHASASSSLAPQGRFSYGPANAIDGLAHTAWCEGAADYGEGQSLEVEWKQGVNDSPGICQLRDLVVVPGYARDESSYENNGRVTRARIESCDRPEDGFEVQLGPDPALLSPVSRTPMWPKNVWPQERPDRWDQPPFEIHVPPGILEKEGRCVRFKILRTRPGKKYSDTCVSELLPRIYCRHEPAPGGAPGGGAR